MKQLLSVLILLFSSTGLFAQSAFQRNVIIDYEWRFFKGGMFGSEMPVFDDSAWRILDLPHDWSIENIPGENTPFDRHAIGQQSTGFTRGGTGWYRKYLEIPASAEGKIVKLRFDGIYANSVVWINGKMAGKNPHGYTAFEFDITDKIIPGKKNLIAVKVMNEGENTRWYSGSGIYRHVWLDILDPVNIPSGGIFVTTPKVEKSSSTVNISTQLTNSSKQNQKLELVNIIHNASGAEIVRNASFQELNAGGNAAFSEQLTINSPEFWSTERPALYTLITEVYRDGKLCDKVVTSFGIRSLQFDAVKGFVLNGNPMKLKGGCVHHDNGPLGAKAYDRAEERKVELLKASGFNAIRCAHNPPSSAFLDACDRLGMLVINEAFDMWETGKHPFDYHLFFKEWWQKDLQSMIVRDRNHPSVMMWSIGNEIPGMNTPEVVNTAKMLADHSRKLDPTRPVTAGVNQVKEDKDPFFAHLDIAGYNYAFDQYKEDHQQHPERVMVATESSAFLAFDYWMGVIDHPWVIGDFVWTAFDYIGEASIGWRGFEPDDKLYPWSLAYCGDIDICGWKRPQSYYRDVLWKPNQISVFVKPPSPTFEINQKKEFWSQWEWHDVLADWTWTGNEGKPLDVSVYSSCEQVELFLNGKSLGKKITNRTNKFTAQWNVPFQPGMLKAVGYTKGRKVNESVLETAGAVNKMHISADRTELSAGSQDLCYFTVELTDSKGVRNPKAENTITFQVEGPGEIVGLGNANPVSLESYQGNTRNAWQGKCLVIVKAGNPGSITLKATTKEGLSGTAAITVK